MRSRLHRDHRACIGNIGINPMRNFFLFPNHTHKGQNAQLSDMSKNMKMLMSAVSDFDILVTITPEVDDQEHHSSYSKYGYCNATLAVFGVPFS
jgi:hypothetical protein